MTRTTALFSPLPLRDLVLKNRIVVSPMWQYAAERGFPTDWHLMHLGRFAEGGAGLVFQEGTSIERRGCGTTGDLGLWDDTFVEPLARVVSFIKANGAMPAVQLMHTGRKGRQKRAFEGGGPLERSPDIPDWDAWELIAPSAIPDKPGYPVPRAMTTRDIQVVTEAWVSAARRAQQAGYEVIEIHAAHGYLLHQFLSPYSNQRGDRYGGSFDNRIRLLLEVLEAVRGVWPQSKPLFVRLSCVDDAGWTLEDSVALSRILGSRGVDVVDCSAGGQIAAPPANLHYGYQVPYAARIRKEAGVRTMAVGLIVHAEQAERILAQGCADLVAMGREFLYNPNWPLDAAQKLGVDPAFSLSSLRSGFWLGKRAAAVPELRPSTFDAEGGAGPGGPTASG